MTKPVKFDAEVREWSFNKHHVLRGRIYKDKRALGYLDGDWVEIKTVQSVSELEDCFIIKTYTWTYMLLKTNAEERTIQKLRDFNIDSKTQNNNSSK